ncbi:lactate permease [Lachnospiraceae bacterium C7]|nr:lactate permease [Lachnospiraceae bacterium C7]
MNDFLLFILALAPILCLIVALTGLKMPGHLACFGALIITAILAGSVWKMTPANIGLASLEGACNALWPIIIVILAALFTYNLTLETKAMDSIKAMLASVSTDKRILMLLIAFGFGNFMEGMAGFGTAVAIPAGILVGLGFEPLLAVVTCLIINSTPTAFGSVGVPVNTMHAITGLDTVGISTNVAIIQAVVQFLIPFIAVVVIGKGFKALKGLVGFTLIADLAYLLPECLVAKFIGPDLADIIGAIICMIVIVIYAMKAKTPDNPEFKVSTSGDATKGLTFGKAFKAWSPFIFVFVFLLLTSKLVPFINKPLLKFASSVKFYPTGKPLTFCWVNTPGVLILLAGFLGGAIQGASFKTMLCILGKTVKSNVKTIITICSVLAVAKIMGYSGMTTSISKELVSVTGQYFPFISPLIGTIGGFVTGSGTSTTALFGDVQVQTAKAIGANPSWLAAGNLMGAGLGKMICPQSIAIGSAAVGLSGVESKIMAKVVVWTISFVVIAGIICYGFSVIGLV